MREIFGLNSTKYLRVSSKITKGFEENGRFAGYFLLTIPQCFVESILEANGSKFRNRLLVVQPYTVMLRYNLKIRTNYKPHDGLSYRGKSEANRGGSRYTRGRGRSHYGPHNRQHQTHNKQAPPRQGRKKAGTPTQVRDAPGKEKNRSEEGEQNQQDMGGGDMTMAKRIALNQARTKATSKEKRQVVFDITCEEGSNQENAPDAAVVYSVLEKELANDPNSQLDTVEAIFTPDATNPWRWSVIFDSTETKDRYYNRETEFSRAINGREVTYRIRTKAAPQRLVITLQSSSLIADDELTWLFRNLRTVEGVQKQMHTFNCKIDSGLRKIFFLLHEGVEARNLPGFITTSDGIRRKLFFQGKSLVLIGNL